MTSPNKGMSQLRGTISLWRVYLSLKQCLGFQMFEQGKSISIEEVDEALNHAMKAKLIYEFTPYEKEIISNFIDGLLDARLELIGK
jgi:hypothetical protein